MKIVGDILLFEAPITLIETPGLLQKVEKFFTT